MGFTQEDLAFKSGIPRPNISSIEKNHRDITLSTLEKLACALGIKTSRLLEETPPASQLIAGRHAADAVAKAIVSGEMLPNSALNQAAERIASLIINQLAAHSAPGARRFRRKKAGGESQRLLNYCLYGADTVERILKRVQKHLPHDPSTN